MQTILYGVSKYENGNPEDLIFQKLCIPPCVNDSSALRPSGDLLLIQAAILEEN